MRRRGWRWRGPAGRGGPGVEAHQIAEVEPHVGSLLGDGTLIVALQNGIPWWYFQRHGGPFEGAGSNPGTPQERLTRALQVGAVRPSMLRDVQAGRPLEIEPLLGALVEPGRLGRQADSVDRGRVLLRAVAELGDRRSSGATRAAIDRLKARPQFCLGRLAALNTFAHLATSAFTRSPSCAGVLGATSNPRCESFSLTSGDCTAPVM